MRLFFSLFLISVLLGNSGFSFLHASHQGAEMSGHSSCLAAELQGMGKCTAAPETPAFALFHIDAIAGLFLAVIDGLFGLLFVSLVCVLVLFLRVARGESFRLLRLLSRFRFAWRDGLSFDFFHIKQVLLRALALHENSPSFS